MERIDRRLSSASMNLLADLVGKTMVSIEHDEFTFTNTSSQVVKFNAKDSSFFLYSFTEPLDYYGKEEDVAVWSFEQIEYPILENKVFITIPVQRRIHSICVVQENQQLYEQDKQIYDVWLTRGVIFDFGDYQFAFEKPIWFSEDIIIRKGYNLLTMFRSENEIEMSGNWTNGISIKCTRSTTVLK
ncbi:MAG: hypothetical protein HUJ69_00325 [Lachnospiraceae bacterium]|nr:hypothetical protein [Lachnospiraceae bacterium]